jgi:hypothetical protein
MRHAVGPLAMLAVTLLMTLCACGSGTSPEKTGTETFGCYVGSCVSPGVTGDDDEQDAGPDDAASQD